MYLCLENLGVPGYLVLYLHICSLRLALRSHLSHM